MTGMKANLKFKNCEDFLHCTFHKSEGPMGNTICLVVINILHMQQEAEKKSNNKIFYTHTLEEHLSPQEFTTDGKVILHTY